MKFLESLWTTAIIVHTMQTLVLRVRMSWVSTNTAPSSHNIVYKACSDANTSAGSRTGAFAGVANWRVPSIDELYSLADKSRASAPFINPIFFPGTASKKYRSSTPDPQDSVQAKVADFNEGNITAYQKLDFFTYYTRCVASP